MKRFFALLTIATLTTAIPQYSSSGMNGDSVIEPAIQPQLESAGTCRTEYVTIWETNYVETEEEICKCETVHKKVPQRVSKIYPKKVCDNSGSAGDESNNNQDLEASAVGSNVD